MNSKKNFARNELLKIFIAISVLLVCSVLYYFYIRKEALRMAEKRAELTLESTERMILVRMGKIETTVNAFRPMAEYALDDPDAMYEIARHIVESSKRVMGAGIAFKTDYYPEKGHWFETYVGYHQGSDSLVTKQLGSAEHNYLQMEWFRKGLQSPMGIWSNPYYDNAGGKTFLVSYCLPVYDSTNEAVGVICTDITLDTLTNIVRSVNLYPNSYCTLVANDGTVLVGPPAELVKKGKTHVFSQPIDGKNMTMTLVIYDSDMYHRLRKSTLFFALMALTGIFSVLFIAYRSMQNLLKLNEVRMKEQQIENELAIARNIQTALLPDKSAAKSIKKLDISGMQLPAKYVGGDIYDYYVRDNKLFFCIGDVSGKGVPAALLMAISHSLFRTLSAHSDRPEHIITDMNVSICDNNPDIMFITMFLGVMDLETGTITYCNAGHNPPILIQSGQAKMMNSAENLLLGVETNAEYTSQTLHLGSGDTLFLYTDGLTEAENTQKVLFEEQKAIDVAKKFGQMSAEEQINAMHTAVKEYVGDAEQSDDLTMLAIRFLESNHSLTLSNNIQELKKLEPFLNNFFEQNNLNMSLLPQFNLALEEAATNVIMYAYPEGETGTAELTLDLTDGQLRATLSDSGTPFNPLEQQEANLDVSLEERQIGGLGIHLIKEIMKDLEYAYNDGKNVLTMTYELG